MKPDRSQVVRVERAPSDTQQQGTGQVMWPAAGAQGSVAGLVTIGRWNSGDLSLARAVRVTMTAINPPVPPANFTNPPFPGAMALINYQGQNGISVKRWVPVPCDLAIVASQVWVQACGVGLPYQALPGNCQPNSTGQNVSFTVAVTFAEELGDVWPSTPLYPASFNSGFDTGASLGGGAALGAQSLIYTQQAQGFSAAGFMRAMEITNASSATVYICIVDAPPVLAGSITANEAVLWCSTIPIAVPSGATILRAFDDLPFFWGPWVVAVNSLSDPALVDGTNIFIEADYAPIVAPGY
jgi:hypothetical protein